MGVVTWSIVAQELAAHYLYLHFHLMHFIFSFTVIAFHTCILYCWLVLLVYLIGIGGVLPTLRGWGLGVQFTDMSGSLIHLTDLYGFLLFFRSSMCNIGGRFSFRLR